MDTLEEDNPFGKAQTVPPEVRAYVYSLVNAVCVSIPYGRSSSLTLNSLVEVVQTTMVATYWVTMPSPVSETSNDG